MNLIANLLTGFANLTVSTNSFVMFYKGEIPAELLKK
ncbi:cyclic lactone autoinducer peptide [Paenibacillus sp. S150]|nr:cyclic lactone autoinducer peptide [Paenibacillus sp. S150]MBW4081854.1 cyclic lactone autoinducer peptide [Paenibacillus sp. S150]